MASARLETPTVPLVGTGPAMEALHARIVAVAPTALPVLINGETGTGKEVVARALHALSGRRGPFVAVDCAALSRQLVETELFGYERGAFTGANQRREGLIHAARGGTFFLDEVGELPLETQTRLLRLLDQGTYRPVGDARERTADVRVIAATWRDLRRAVAEGAFRGDLFHRLSVVELVVPPLRERPEDLDLLFDLFLAESTAANARVLLSVDPSVRMHLRRWPWPGNVRELRNVAAYVGALAKGPRVRLDDLPGALFRDAKRSVHSALVLAEIRTDLSYMEARRVYLDDFQHRYVDAVLHAHGGNVSAAARAAGMDRRSIQRIMKRSRSR